MRFVRETSASNLIRAYEPGLIRVNSEDFRCDLILSAEHLVMDWEPPGVIDLTVPSLQPALDLEPEILILGTGRTLVFPEANLHGELGALGIGVEIMDTAAACRTYNVLTHDDRPVVAALINRS